MSWWLRIARLLRQSRIRLPRAPVDPSEIRPGDWVQIHSETWRVASRRYEKGRVAFRLRPLDARGGAVLTRRGDDGWRLEKGGCEVEVPAELLVVFPVV